MSNNKSFDTIYITDKGNFVYSFSNIKKFKGYLKKVKACDNEDIDLYTGMLKVHDLTMKNFSCLKDFYKALLDKTNIVILAQANNARYCHILTLEEAIESIKDFEKDYSLFVYEYFDKGFDNPNLEEIKRKSKATKLLNERIVQTIPLIDSITKQNIDLNQDMVLKIINAELKKHGFEEIKNRYININVYWSN